MPKRFSQLLLPFPEVPSSPEWPLTASDVTKESVTLSWKPPPDDGGSPLTAYIIDKLDLEYGGWVRANRVPPQTTSLSIPNLIKNHRYNFRVYAENKCGVSEPVELSEPIKATSGIGEYMTLRKYLHSFVPMTILST